MIGFVWLSYTLHFVAEAGECSSFHDLVQMGQESLWIGDVEAVEQTVVRIQERFQCTESMAQESITADLGDWFLLQAYLAHLNAHQDLREEWLQQAVNLGYWNGNYGNELYMLYQSLSPKRELFFLDHDLSNYVDIRIDGQSIEQNSMVSSGWHWLEYTDSKGETFFQWSNWQTGIPLEIFPRLSVDPNSIQAYLALKKRQRHRQQRMLMWGIFATAAHVVAMMEYVQYPSVSTIEELERQRNVVRGWGGMSLLSSSFVLVTYIQWRTGLYVVHSFETGQSIDLD